MTFARIPRHRPASITDSPRERALAQKSLSFFHSLHFALKGARRAWRREFNLRVQILLCIAVVVVAYLLHVPLLGIALLVLVAGLVFTLELMNAALEALADALHPTYHPLIAEAKDIAAAAVLIISLAAVGIGLLVLLPPLGRFLVGF